MPAYFNDDLHTLIYKFSKAAGEAQAGPVYDPDAEAYFNNVLVGSGQEVEDKEVVSNFIIGLKAIGEWNYTLEAWTGRSSQNAGTGTALYGIKNSFNGTIVNGPVWGADGIQNTTNGYITTTGLFAGSNTTLLMVAKADSGNAASFYSSLSNLNTRGIRLRQYQAVYGNGSLQTVDYDLAQLGVYQLVGASFGANLTIFKEATSFNGGSISPPVVTPSNSLFLFAGDGGGQYLQGKFVCAVALSHAITDATAIRALLKNTLAQGLLP